MRIGLISDTHMPGSTRELWPQVYSSFADVDYILHGGDIYTADILDDLTEMAPVYVARGNGDRSLLDDRVKDTWQVDIDGINIGLVHQFPSPSRKSDSAILDHVNRIFPDSMPDVVVYGHTHMEAIDQVEQLLCVNPGSPTLPRNKSLRLGTIGFLDIAESTVRASVHRLTHQGTEELAGFEQILSL